MSTNYGEAEEIKVHLVDEVTFRISDSTNLTIGVNPLDDYKVSMTVSKSTSDLIVCFPYDECIELLTHAKKSS